MPIYVIRDKGQLENEACAVCRGMVEAAVQIIFEEDYSDTDFAVPGDEYTPQNVYLCEKHAEMLTEKCGKRG